MSRQGRSLSADEIEKIVRLLSTTDLYMVDIADRMGCSKSTVVTINRKYGIRAYNKKGNPSTMTKDSV